MSSLVVIGAQWGDEGKGKLVDYLTINADLVVRFQGGNNAGHTLVVNGETTKLSLVPSGVLHPKTKCAIGAGVVINPDVFLSEVSKLKEAGVAVDPKRLVIDGRAHIILPYHVAVDQAREEKRGENKIGTTGRGIGPAYEDAAARCGVQLSELRDLPKLLERLEGVIAERNLYINNVLGVQKTVSLSEVEAVLKRVAPLILPFMADVSYMVHEASLREERIVFEGAQGTLLDKNFGTIPFVTSSHTIAGAVATGVGVSPKFVSHVLGVAKAYCTRVGSGPFPSEIFGDLAENLRTVGGEFGVVTGRSRRIGWFDAVAMRYAARVNGISSLALTKLDVLSNIPKIKVCVGYNGVTDEGLFLNNLENVEPQYIELDGWEGDISKAQKLHHLPQTAQVYLSSLEELCGIPISMISVGAERDATIFSNQASFIKGFSQ